MNKSKFKIFTVLILCITTLCLFACTEKEHSSSFSDTVNTSVYEIDKYGHAVLSMTAGELSEAGYEPGDVVYININTFESEMPYYDGYYTAPGELLLRGKSPDSNLKICINYGSFSEETGITAGDPVNISMVEKAGMLDIQELYALKYSFDRADYADDATFANFREITLGDIGDSKLYRSASPINNKYGRASYANDLIEAAKVRTVLNLSDSNEVIEKCFTEEDFDSEYYRTLYESGKIKIIDLTGNFYSDDFAASLAEGLTFLSQNDPPYCIHCIEGNERASFAAMLLEALMGAKPEDIIDDYMISFYNYYGVTKEKEPERYEVFWKSTLIL